MKNIFTIILLFGVWVAQAQMPDIDSLITKAESLNGREQVMMYSDISYYASFGNTDLALDYANKCLDAAKSAGDSLLIAEGYNVLAIAWYMKSYYPEALDYNMKALNIRLKYGDNYSLLSSYSKTGNCLYEMGRYDEAIGYYLKALKISEENDLTQQTGLISNNIAELFKMQENYDQAQAFYQISIQIASEIADTVGLAKAYINQGVLFKLQSRFIKADSLFKIAYDLIHGKGFMDIEAGLQINFGTLYKEWGQLEKSTEYYKAAEALYGQSGELLGLSIVSSNLGNTYLVLGQHKTALDYYKKGIGLANTTNSMSRMIAAYEGITNYYRVTGDYRNAYHSDSIADVYRDSVFNAEKTRIIQELNTRYETGKKEKQIAEQEIVLAQQALSVQQKNLQLLGAIGGLFIVLLLAILVYRSQQSRQEKLRQLVALEKVEAVNKIQNEKLRISRDLHDNIGSQLTFVISTLDNLSYMKTEVQRDEKLGLLRQFTRDTMAQLRETIWALNIETISIDQLSSKIAAFIRQAKLARPEIQFVIEGNPTAKELNANQAINTYRTMQEAINNSIKYACPKTITITFSDNKLSINDDGIGFDRASIAEGNGLRNMESRMKEVGFHLSVSSQPGRGTEISIFLS